MSITPNNRRSGGTPARSTTLALVLAAVGAGSLGACTSAGVSSSEPPVTPVASESRQTPAPSETAAPSPTPAPVIDPGDGGNYAPVLDPADFVDRIDNPYLPLSPGARWVYEGTSDGATERIVVTVTDKRRTILGISAIVVRDTVSTDGQVTEDTYDWFAQDRDGNVWYLGESVKDFENGVLTSTAGSWEAGVGGAVPGIVMPAKPGLGTAYRQEFWLGEAEDMAEVIDVGGTRTVPEGSYNATITTRDWTPLAAEVIEEKVYAPGVGLIAESHVAGGEGAVALVQFRSGT